MIQQLLTLRLNLLEQKILISIEISFEYKKYLLLLIFTVVVLATALNRLINKLQSVDINRKLAIIATVFFNYCNSNSFLVQRYFRPMAKT